MTLGKNKKGIPRHQQEPAIPKFVPKARTFSPQASSGLLRIRFSYVDVGGPWCLTDISKPHHADLLERLRSLESMACSEVFAPGSQTGKVYEVVDLPTEESRARLVELLYDDQTEIARLRISGERRQYGFLPNGGPDFYALWWDPEHQVWPSPKKHT